MQRISTIPRKGWQQKVEELGFSFHTLEDTYWDESAYYRFSIAQINELETATQEVYDMCLEAVEYILENDLFDRLHIPRQFVSYIKQSWEEDHPAIYGRFDFSYDGEGPPKLLEFNADTPTALFEAGIVQWFWLEESFPAADQFNSIHEKLVAGWESLKEYLHPDKLYFTCVRDSAEDRITTDYLRDCAIQAGLETEFIYIDDIGFAPDLKGFVDLDKYLIRNIFKLYPWEWMIHEEFAPKLLVDANKTFWIEPAWKMILSNKGILPILWELFPDHPNLLPAYFEDSAAAYAMDDYVRKPLLSREGANIEIVRTGHSDLSTGGEYGEEGYIRQALHLLPDFDGNYPVIGSWVISQEPAGIGIRESNSPITDNTSRFLPHIIA